MVAHAGIDHDRVVRCLHDVALDAEHQLILGIEEPGLQPPSILVEKLPRHGREKLHRLEEWTLLLDDAVDRSATNFDRGGQDGPPSPCQSRAPWDWIESSSHSRLFIEHDLVGKPVPTFPDHALATAGRQIGMLQPVRQISLAGFGFQHDRSARERIDAIGDRQRFLDQLLDQ